VADYTVSTWLSLERGIPCIGSYLKETKLASRHSVLLMFHCRGQRFYIRACVGIIQLNHISVQLEHPMLQGQHGPTRYLFRKHDSFLLLEFVDVIFW
jgi:hypothetical protein